MLPTARGQLLDDGVSVPYFFTSGVWRGVGAPPKSSFQIPDHPGASRNLLYVAPLIVGYPGIAQRESTSAG